MRSSRFYPVIIGGGRFKKGMCVGKRDLCFVWLKREFKSGENFERTDIDKVDTVLHFCDRPSLERTIEALQLMLENWENPND